MREPIVDKSESPTLPNTDKDELLSIHIYNALGRVGVVDAAFHGIIECTTRALMVLRIPIASHARFS